MAASSPTRAASDGIDRAPPCSEGDAIVGSGAGAGAGAGSGAGARAAFVADPDVPAVGVFDAAPDPWGASAPAPGSVALDTGSAGAANPFAATLPAGVAAVPPDDTVPADPAGEGAIGAPGSARAAALPTP